MEKSTKTLHRLERLRQLNADRNWVNDDLYRLLYKEDLYIVAYERIKSTPGNMTPGSDGKTIDGISMQEIHTIIREMQTEQFQFKAVRTVYIPKANGKKRKLGIPIGLSYCLSFPARFGIPMVASAGGPEARAHPSRSTLPCFAAGFQRDEVSSVAESACEAPRCVLGSG